MVESLENHISIVLYCLQLKTKKHQELDESGLFVYKHQSEGCFLNFQLKQESASDQGPDENLLNRDVVKNESLSSSENTIFCKKNLDELLRRKPIED